MEKILPKITVANILEGQRMEENIAYIDARLAELAEDLGRELTEAEQSVILDIVDEYTPHDEEGNFLCDLLPFEYAWEIYQVKKHRKLLK